MYQFKSPSCFTHDLACFEHHSFRGKLKLFLKVPQHLTVHLEIIMQEPLKAEGLK